MSRPKGKPSASLIDRMTGEASWLLSHAQALAGYGREPEAAEEWARASICEEQAAALLDADGQELEAAIHRVSAASCCELLGQFVRAVTLLRAALSAPLRQEYRGQVEQLLARCLLAAQKELSRDAKWRQRNRPSPVS